MHRCQRPRMLLEWLIATCQPCRKRARCWGVTRSCAASGPEEWARCSQRTIASSIAMAKISDPAVVHVYEVGSIDGQAFVAMELIDGVNLRAWCRREPRSWQDITKVMLAAGRGLVAAHDAGVVHRDVKP